MKTLKYYYTKDNQITEVIFDKYTIDTNIGNALKCFRNGKIIISYGRTWKPL
jgi:hypothetical protein